MVHKVQLVQRALKVLLVKMALMVLKAKLVPLELQESPAQPVLQGHKELLGMMV